MAVIYYTQDFRVYEETCDGQSSLAYSKGHIASAASLMVTSQCQGRFLPHPFLREKPWGRGCPFLVHSTDWLKQTTTFVKFKLFQDQRFQNHFS